MLSNRTKVVRGVMVFLAGCAVLGFITGLRGAMPPAEADYDSGAPLSTASGVVVEASPMSDAPPPAPVEEDAEQAEEDEAAAEEPAREEEPEPEPTPPPPRPAPAPAPKAEPREEPPSSDPVGDLLTAPPPLADLY
jgi:hypothetical protein